MEIDIIVQKCLQNDARAQRMLFDMYAGKMMILCRRYAKNEHEAEDFLQEGFIRMFRYLESYQGKGSFDGWIRRIFVNTSIRNYHRQTKHHQNQQLDYAVNHPAKIEDAISKLSQTELLGLIQQLPEGYRIVFNMYAIEGYSHKEIGEMLEIQESTSRSQLVKARKWLQNKITEQTKIAI